MIDTINTREIMDILGCTHSRLACMRGDRKRPMPRPIGREGHLHIYNRIEIMAWIDSFERSSLYVEARSNLDLRLAAKFLSMKKIKL
jgi:hypothetical protein